MPNLEERTDDVRAILDAIGSEQAALLGQGYGCPDCSLLRGLPSRSVSRSSSSTPPTVKAGLRTDDFPWGPTEEEQRAWRETAEEWGTDAFAASWVARLAPSAADRRAVRRVGGEDDAHGGEPGDCPGVHAHADVSWMRGRCCRSIRVPTLVLDRAEAHLPKGPVDMPPLEESRYIAERIPGREVRRPSGQGLPAVGRRSRTASSSEVARFVTGAAPARRPDRVLAHGAVHRHGRLDAARCRARRPALARAPRAAQRSRTWLPRRVPRAGGRPRGRRLSRRPSTARRARFAAPRRSSQSAATRRARDPRRRPLGRGRAPRAGHRRHRRARRRPRGGRGGAGRGARHVDREGPRRRLGIEFVERGDAARSRACPVSGGLFSALRG